MIDRKDYPYFSYFMDIAPALSECIDDPDYKLSKNNEIFSEITKIFRIEENAKTCVGLKKDIKKLKEKNIDPCEMQVFFVRQYGYRFRQKEIPILLDKILEGLES